MSKQRKTPKGYIKVRFIQPWQSFQPGDETELGKGQAATLKERGIIECDLETKKKPSKMVKVRLLSEWGGHEAGTKIELEEGFAKDLAGRVIIKDDREIRFAKILA
jgi:hypothetical protein